MITQEEIKYLKEFKFGVLLALAAVAFSSCSKVPAGNVGIKFHLLGSSKGVDYDVLEPGRYWIGVNEELFIFPTRNQNKTWTNDRREDSPNAEGFEFQSKEGMKLTANVGLEYRIKDADVPKVFEMYKKGADEITNKVLRNSIRDAFNKASSTRNADEMYGEGKVSFMNEVGDLAKSKALQKNITIVDIYLVGNVGIPTTVTQALNRKIEANQRAEQRENELREAEAEAKKIVAQAEGKAKSMEAIAEGKAKSILVEAEAQARANKLLNQSLTQSLVEYKKVEKWDGKVPQVSGGGASIINLK